MQGEWLSNCATAAVAYVAEQNNLYMLVKLSSVSDSESGSLPCPRVRAPRRERPGPAAGQELHHAEPGGPDPGTRPAERAHQEPALCPG